ncbi:hypothetical protein AMTRI_Chr03g55040 [Amborella trichopoda]
MGLKIVLFLCFLGVSTSFAQQMFNVKDFGAKASPQNEDTQAFLDTWKAACSSGGEATFYVPEGTYYTGALSFIGPCKNLTRMTFTVKGTLKAFTDLGKFAKDGAWIMFGWVNDLTVNGGGVFDGQGTASWGKNKCGNQKYCNLLPTSLKFHASKNVVLQDVTSLNSKFFHIAVLQSTNFKVTGVTVTAPGDSPNTDGIHIERSVGVTISHTNIGTGDDCISIGEGNSHVSIDNVNCGPGHGISVGSLGKYPYEGDVDGVTVTSSTFTKTTNGIRIKSWQASPKKTLARNMTFDNLVMNNVQNPIIIDQEYCPSKRCGAQTPSLVQIKDVTFKNIRGTASSENAVTLRCSSGYPCQNLVLEDINFKYDGSATWNYVKGHELPAKAFCSSVKASYKGVQIPPPCQ